MPPQLLRKTLVSWSVTKKIKTSDARQLHTCHAASADLACVQRARHCVLNETHRHHDIMPRDVFRSPEKAAFSFPPLQMCVLSPASLSFSADFMNLTFPSLSSPPVSSPLLPSPPLLASPLHPSPRLLLSSPL